MPRVAVVDRLGPVRAHLRAAGCQVLPLRPGVAGVAGVRVIVVSGVDDYVTGNQRAAAPVPVINAAGKSPAEVLARPSGPRE